MEIPINKSMIDLSPNESKSPRNGRILITKYAKYVPLLFLNPYFWSEPQIRRLLKNGFLSFARKLSIICRNELWTTNKSFLDEFELYFLRKKIGAEILFLDPSHRENRYLPSLNRPQMVQFSS